MDAAAKSIAQGATGAMEVLSSFANRMRIAAKDRADAQEAARARSAGPTVRERQEDLVRFYNRYEDLVELLCDSAQFGPTPKLEATYAELKAWMESDYPIVQPFLAAFLRYDEDDAAHGDAFLGLVGSPDLDAFLRTDDGSTIDRINRTREALNLYGEHLRQLAAKIA